MIDMSFQERLHFSGNVKNESTEVLIENIVIDRKKYHHLDDIVFNARFSDSDRAALRSLLLKKRADLFYFKTDLFSFVLAQVP